MTDLYVDPIEDIDFDSVRTFIRGVEDTKAATESRTFEFKERLSKSNVVEAIAALANADGGLVFVGVADRAKGDDRLVGVSREELDSIVNSLRSILPDDAFPDVAPVAIPPENERVIVVLRVDADRALQPVVVGGKVLVRYPGQTVPADRAQIVALVHRAASTPAQDGLALTHLPIDGLRSNLFADDTPGRAFELRLIGSVTLPHRVRHRPWLDSAARSAIVDSLTQSPLPDDMWFERAPRPQRDAFVWEENDARSTWGRYGSQPPTMRWQRDPVIRVGGAYVTLQGRLLRVLVGVGIHHESDNISAKLSLDRVYRGLLALLITHRNLVRTVARSLDASEPMEFRGREAWLVPGESRKVEDVIALDEFAPRGPGGSDQMLHFVPLVSGSDIDDLETLVRTWLEIAMLDAGARGFEDALLNQPRPEWVGDADR